MPASGNSRDSVARSRAEQFAQRELHRGTWAPVALGLVDRPILVVRLDGLTLYWANEVGQRRLQLAVGDAPASPARLLPELEVLAGPEGVTLPPGFRLSWQTQLPAGRRHDDRPCQAHVSLEVLAGEPEGLAVIVIAEQDNPASASAANEIPAAAIDRLTGLPDRQYFFERLRDALLRQQSGDEQIAVAFIDVDHFKQVNDSRGHLAGDEVLCRIADCLRRSLRPGDLVARYGGDEFVVLLHEVGSLRQARGVARRLRGALASDKERLSTTASLGLAVVNVREAEPTAVLHAADEAMYQAKRRGHAGHSVVRPLVPFTNPPAASPATA